MFGKKRVVWMGAIVAGISLLTGCGQQSKKYDERAKVERITALIDAKNFGAILKWHAGLSESGQKKYARYAALAELGAGGFDPVDFVGHILAPQRFASRERAALYAGCDNAELDSFDQPEMRCLMVRLMNQLPDAEDAHLRAGEARLVELSKAGELTDSDQTLLLIVETAIVVKRVGNVLESYLKLRGTLTEKHLGFFYQESVKAALASQQWIESMDRIPEDLSRQLTGLSHLSILNDVKGKTKFVQETGIPYVLENIAAENRDSMAQVSKIFLMQTIDTVLHDYFKVEPTSKSSGAGSSMNEG